MHRQGMAMRCTFRVASGDVLFGTEIRAAAEELAVADISKRWSFEANQSPPLFS